MTSINDLKNLLSLGKIDEFIRILNSEEFDFSSNKQIAKLTETDQKLKKSLKQLNIAIIGSFTLNNIKERIVVEGIKKGFHISVQFGDFDQHLFELLNKDSFIYKSKFDFVILSIDTHSAFNNLEYDFVGKKKEEIDSNINERISHLKQALAFFKDKSGANLIVTNLIVPAVSPLGLYETKAEYGYLDAIREYNQKLKESIVKEKRFYLLDIDSIAAMIGKASITDNKLYFIGKILFNDSICSKISNRIISVISASTGKAKKCLVCDLDNTIWGGVVGEVGPHGIKIADDGPGLIYKTIQKIILNLYRRGIIIAIVSKNNPEDAIAPFKENKNMILGLDNVAVFKANWNEKAANIKEIAEELNIGIDSVVFLDDNPSERILVKNILPEVEIIDFPQDISNLPDVLLKFNSFDKLQMTAEDMSKGKMYAQDNKRKMFRSEIKDEKEYLKELEIELLIEKANESNLERITELTNKTNQFNLRTQRFTISNMENFAKDPNHRVYSVSAKDKFGEQGLTGIIMLKKEMDGWFIENYLLSCRILGRGIEYEFLYATLKDIKEKVSGEYLPTAKNSQVTEFYLNAGFEKIGKKFIFNPEKNKLKRSPWIKWVYQDGRN